LPITASSEFGSIGTISR